MNGKRDPAGREWGKWLRSHDGDGREHLKHVSDAELQGDAAALASTLGGDACFRAKPSGRTARSASFSTRDGERLGGRGG